MQIEKMAVVGTIHLSLQTREWLEALNWQSEGPAGGPITYGWMVYAHDDNECSVGHAEHAPAGEYPADLWAVFKMAHEKRVSYIKFDQDEFAIDGLTEYDDSPAPVNAAGILEVAS